MTTERTVPDALRALAWPTYFLAFLLVAASLLDYLANVWPLQMGEVRWRYGAAGLFAGFLLTPLLGVWLAAVVATLMRHRLATRAIALLSIVLALLLLVVCVEFAMDAIEVRPKEEVPHEAIWTFDVGVAKAVAKMLAAAAMLVWLGWVCFKSAKASALEAEQRRQRETTPLLVTGSFDRPKT